ncbi:MAG: regulatory protein RecX [Myxococcales bacterium]|nr:regulatory protein RecX [Myxococcales bacterium]
MPPSDDRSGGARRGRRIRPLSPERLREAALHYLGQRDASRAQLRRVLVRRVDRAVAVHGQPREPLIEAIDALLADFARLGYLDDARYAEVQARSLRRRGASTRAIRAKLAERGVAAELVDDAIETRGDVELVAALRHLRRRRHGPFAREDREPDRAKELASLGRAGFSYELAARAWALPRAEAEALLDG